MSSSASLGEVQARYGVDRRDLLHSKLEAFVVCVVIAIMFAGSGYAATMNPDQFGKASDAFIAKYVCPAVGVVMIGLGMFIWRRIGRLGHAKVLVHPLGLTIDDGARQQQVAWTEVRQIIVGNSNASTIGLVLFGFIGMMIGHAFFGRLGGPQLILYNGRKVLLPPCVEDGEALVATIQKRAFG